ncbi:MAG: putative phosphatase [Patescibacteria group bacterium]|nr:histidine phosphatase family protein [Candidatus Saccharibacteria bacterium]MDQ5963048.1 putative phosphatase [Patescibacteria group bacterium]
MKKIYYARHGESFINVEDVFSSRPGTPLDKGLTPTGIQQARDGALHAKEKGIKFEYIVCSTSRRAHETAEIIAEIFGYPIGDIEYSDDFIELQFGELEGAPWNAFWESGKTYHDLSNYKNAETIELLQKRAAKALAYVQSLPYESVLVVSHSGFGRAFRRALHNEPYTLEFTMDKSTKSLPHGELLTLQ